MHFICKQFLFQFYHSSMIQTFVFDLKVIYLVAIFSLYISVALFEILQSNSEACCLNRNRRWFTYIAFI